MDDATRINLICITVFVCGSLLSGSFLLDALEQRTWPIASGTIITSEPAIVEVYDSEYGEWYDEFGVIVEYQYDVAGQRFVNDRVKNTPLESHRVEGRVDFQLKPYPVGRWVDVYYNPKNPADSILEPAGYGGPILGFFLSALALSLPLLQWVTKRSQKQFEERNKRA